MEGEGDRMGGGGPYAMEGPRDLALAMERRRAVPDGPGERFAGYGLMGLPFASGHVLAFRRMTASSLGLPYTTVWHRDPGGVWTFYGDVEPEQSCPRYFGEALHRVVMGEIDLTWDGPLEVSFRIPAARLQWGIRFTSDVLTAGLRAGGRILPGPFWKKEWTLRALGKVAGRILGIGTLALSGAVPNGQRFQLSPRLLWRVAASTALLDGEDLGVLGPLPRQARLGDFWIPNRGILAFGEVGYEALDPVRHSRASTRWSLERCLTALGG